MSKLISTGDSPLVLDLSILLVTVLIDRCVKTNNEPFGKSAVLCISYQLTWEQLTALIVSLSLQTSKRVQVQKDRNPLLPPFKYVNRSPPEVCTCLVIAWLFKGKRVVSEQV